MLATIANQMADNPFLRQPDTRSLMVGLMIGAFLAIVAFGNHTAAYARRRRG